MATVEAPTEKKPKEVCRFLVIEDSKTVRGYIKRTLEGAFPECEVHEAEEGQRGLFELTRGGTSLVITDLQMPGMDGLTFIKYVKRDPMLWDVPIVVLSGIVSPEVKKKFEDVAGLCFLKKPSTKEELAHVVKCMLRPESVQSLG